MRPSTELPLAVRHTLDPENFDPAEWEKLKRFTGFDEGDAQRLRDLSVRVDGHIKEVVDRFYAHLLTFGDTREILQSHDVETRLKDSQAHYLRSIFNGDYGEDYLRERLRMGLAHERVGLSLRWYLGGYWLYLRELVPVLLEGVGERRLGELMSFLKAIILDCQLVSESYVGKTMALVRRQNERLEEIVVERTRKLNQWERLAAVGSMSAKVAHEIRNPLSSITLNTELLADEIAGYSGADTGEARDLLDSISGELDRLRRIVEEYLQFARMPRLDLEPVELPQLIVDVAKFVEEEFGRLGIHFQLQATEKLPPIALDRNQFRQVLLNLFRNAQEAMPAGGTLKVTVRGEKRGTVTLTVRDSGVGIDPRQADKLFDPFYTTKDTGTGLGLPFVQQVVQELRGEINVRGEQGRGACFEIVFPEELVMQDWKARHRGSVRAPDGG